MRFSWNSIVLGSLLCLAAGCGGSGTGGLAVTGTVAVDGQPLPWGRVYLHSTDVDQQGNTSQAFYEVRNGQFHADAGSGLPAGDYAVTVFIHEGMAPPPADASAAEASPPTPVVTGQWEGTATIAPNSPLSLDVKQADVKPPEGTGKRFVPNV